MEGHRLLVRHREHEVAAVAIFQMEDLGNVVAPALLPELGRRDQRRQHLLRADRVHLLADDLDDLLVDSPAQRQQREEPGADLAHVAAAHEQAMARRLGVGGIVAERRDVELGEALHVPQNLPDLDPSADGSERPGATGRPGPSDAAGGTILSGFVYQHCPLRARTASGAPKNQDHIDP